MNLPWTALRVFLMLYFASGHKLLKDVKLCEIVMDALPESSVLQRINEKEKRMIPQLQLQSAPASQINPYPERDISLSLPNPRGKVSRKNSKEPNPGKVTETSGSQHTGRLKYPELTAALRRPASPNRAAESEARYKKNSEDLLRVLRPMYAFGSLNSNLFILRQDYLPGIRLQHFVEAQSPPPKERPLTTLFKMATDQDVGKDFDSDRSQMDLPEPDSSINPKDRIEFFRPLKSGHDIMRPSSGESEGRRSVFVKEFTDDSESTHFEYDESERPSSVNNLRLNSTKKSKPIHGIDEPDLQGTDLEYPSDVAERGKISSGTEAVEKERRRPKYKKEKHPRLRVPQENEIRFVINVAPNSHITNFDGKKDTLIHEEPRTENLLSILKDTNKLPKNLTPDNINNGIKILTVILERLNQGKKSEGVHPIFNPPVSPKNTPSETSEVNIQRPEKSQNFPLKSRTSTPGMPGIDYPTYSFIPQTKFDCSTQRYKGFFGDPDTKCQVWHYCDLNGGQASFLCPNGTIFSQVALTCDWWFNVKCESTSQLYVLNERLYKYILPFSPSFPEDYSGPVVDSYLTAKFMETEAKSKKNALKSVTPVSSTTTYIKPRPTDLSEE